MCVCVCGVQYHQCAPSLGGMVVKEIIRPALSTSQQQTKPPKRRPKQSSTNVSQASKSSKSNYVVPVATQKKPKHQKSVVIDKKQRVEEQSPEVVTDEEDTKKNTRIPPISPRHKESLGSALLKVLECLNYNTYKPVCWPLVTCI